jgi:hypothetical protein
MNHMFSLGLFSRGREFMICLRRDCCLRVGQCGDVHAGVEQETSVWFVYKQHAMGGANIV